MTSTDNLADARDDLRATARALFAEHVNSNIYRSSLSESSAFQRSLYEKMVEMGWTTIEVPEEFGGSGADFGFSGVLLEEMGRSLVGGAFLTTAVLATGALLYYGTQEQRNAWLPKFASGEALCAVAVSDLFKSSKGQSGVVAIRHPSSGWILSGQTDSVLDANTANVLLILAKYGEDFHLFLVERDRAGVEVNCMPTVDITREMGLIKLTDVRIPDDAALQTDELGGARFELLLNRASVAISCDSLGIAERALESTVEYARLREQFGRPIGSFQAVKHQCANMLVALESSRVMVRAAAQGVANYSHIGPSVSESGLASMAKTLTSETAVDCAGRGIQLHGGIGYTWEHDMHLILKRACLNEAICGTVYWHRQRISKLIAPI